MTKGEHCPLLQTHTRQATFECHQSGVSIPSIGLICVLQHDYESDDSHISRVWPEGCPVEVEYQPCAVLDLEPHIGKPGPLRSKATRNGEAPERGYCRQTGAMMAGKDESTTLSTFSLVMQQRNVEPGVFEPRSRLQWWRLLYPILGHIYFLIYARYIYI